MSEIVSKLEKSILEWITDSSSVLRNNNKKLTVTCPVMSHPLEPGKAGNHAVRNGFNESAFYQEILYLSQLYGIAVLIWLQRNDYKS